jgi:hypothetical protein
MNGRHETVVFEPIHPVWNGLESFPITIDIKNETKGGITLCQVRS